MSWTSPCHFIARSGQPSFLVSSASFASPISSLQVTRNSLRTNTCHAPTSISPRGASSSLSKWSKVLQFRERTLLIPLVSIPSHALCPVQALREFFEMCPAPASSPAFVIPTAIGLRSLSYSSFTKHLKDLLRLAGFSPNNYSGHSFRRGGATYASSLGISHELIQLQGDWASTAYLEYLARPLRQRYTLAEQVATQIATSTSTSDSLLLQ